MKATKSYEEIIDFIAAGSTPEAVVAFHPSDSVRQRVAELVERSKKGASGTKYPAWDGLSRLILLFPISREENKTRPGRSEHALTSRSTGRADDRLSSSASS